MLVLFSAIDIPSCVTHQRLQPHLAFPPENASPCMSFLACADPTFPRFTVTPHPPLCSAELHNRCADRGDGSPGGPDERP